MISKKNAQSAVEFMVILSAILFFFVTFFAIIQMNVEKKNLEKEKIVIRSIALDVQDEINIAKKSSEGYSRKFKVPENIFGKNYEINISGNFIYVSLKELGISYKISEINGSIKKGFNLIRKENGTVYLN